MSTSPHSTPGPDFHIGSNFPGQVALPGPGLYDVHCDALRFAINSTQPLSPPQTCQGFRYCVVKYHVTERRPWDPCISQHAMWPGQLAHSPCLLQGPFLLGVPLRGQPSVSLYQHTGVVFLGVEHAASSAHRCRLAQCRLLSSGRARHSSRSLLWRGCPDTPYSTGPLKLR